MSEKNEQKNYIKNTAKELAYLAVFVALVIVAQLIFAVVPGVEIVTLLFIAYNFVFGVRRGLVAATAFSLLRQLLFGFYPNVLVLYLLYYNLLAVLFGWVGHKVKNPLKSLWWIVVVACFCALCFSMLDNIITPLWYRYSKRAFQAYFLASIPFMLPQIVCTAVTVGLSFYPLYKVFGFVKRSLRQ